MQTSIRTFQFEMTDECTDTDTELTIRARRASLGNGSDRERFEAIGPDRWRKLWDFLASRAAPLGKNTTSRRVASEPPSAGKIQTSRRRPRTRPHAVIVSIDEETHIQALNRTPALSVDEKSQIQALEPKRRTHPLAAAVGQQKHI